MTKKGTATVASQTRRGVRLQQVVIEGYRSCKTVTFNPTSELSALIGINGAGKTNLLNAIRLLTLRARAGFRSHGTETSTEQTTVTAWFSVRGKQIGLRRKVALAASNRNEDEIVSVAELWNVSSIAGKNRWLEIPPPFYRHERLSPRMAFERQEYLFENPGLWKSVRLRQEEIELMTTPAVMTAIRHISDFRANITYYSASQFTDPTRCPSSFEIDEDGRLSETYGSSRAHLKFIYDLHRLRASAPAKYAEYANFVSREQLGLISRIVWKKIELSSNTADVKSGGRIRKIKKTKTLVIPKVQIGSSYITFNQLSEGTFKTLALIFYIMTEDSECLLIEEPEVCIHHGLLSRIVGTIKAHSKNKQIVFSTHSDLVLDDIEPSDVFVVEMKKRGTAVSPLEAWVGTSGKAALHAYLEEAGTLGEYWRSGGLS